MASSSAPPKHAYARLSSDGDPPSVEQRIHTLAGQIYALLKKQQTIALHIKAKESKTLDSIRGCMNDLESVVFACENATSIHHRFTVAAVVCITTTRDIGTEELSKSFRAVTGKQTAAEAKERREAALLAWDTLVKLLNDH